jgi:ATP-dependent DNA helicase RecQ
MPERALPIPKVEPRGDQGAVPRSSPGRAPLLDAGDSGAVWEELLAVIERTWGFSSLRPLQAEAMQATLDSRDALVVLATGGGKSLCYQAPALVRDGLTVVVSPLISLMKDQIDGLVSSGVEAAMLTSAQDGFELNQVRRGLDDGRFKLLFVAPERLMMNGFVDDLARAGLSTLVIDEAHCISHWGHDFRPEYRQIGELRARHPEIPIQAYTATATPAVQKDVARQLGLTDPIVLVGSFDRPNLSYRFQARSDLLSQVHGVILRHPEQAGIVYCLRRKDVEQLAGQLASKGVRCLPYHAGLASEVRKRNQELFLQEEIDVIVATVAFGMGIDRSDVRFVVHASLPKGIEQYSQESGRAGRDGLEAECVLFYSGADYHGWKNLMERSAAESPESSGPDELERGVARLREMFRFASGATCRHRFLVEHFGGSWHGSGDVGDGCGACDVCLGELKIADDGAVLAQKILSCVVRCEQRYGSAHVADVLRGADTARIRMAGHERLSTYGLLKQHTAREIRGWIDQLVALEHLRVAPGQYPTLFLSQSGVEVMRAERAVTLFETPQPKRSRGRRSLAQLASDEGSPPVDEVLFDRLRQLRRRLAAERGVPAYLIFSDRTLAGLASHKPDTRAGMLAIKGVGERKATDLGGAFLAEIAAHVSASGPSDPDHSQRSAAE